MYSELYVRTQYDGRDYISVEQIYYIDEDGDEHECEAATSACIDITTCADQGTDLWSWLREQVGARLRQAGILYEDIYFDEE